MSVRTLVGVLLAVLGVVLASYLSNLNLDLLTSRFQLTPGASLPVYLVLLIKPFKDSAKSATPE